MAESSLGLALVGEGIEAALGRFMALDPESARRIKPLLGKRVALRVLPFVGTVHVYHAASGVQVHGNCERLPDVTLTGTPWAFAAAALDRSGENTPFGAGIQVDGDAEVAKRFATLWKALHIDWEGLLAQALGDPIGHGIARRARALHHWGLESIKTLRLDLAEYLQEESRALPAEAEVAAFLRDVDTLRSDSDRLTARIEQMRLKTSGQGAS